MRNNRIHIKAVLRAIDDRLSILKAQDEVTGNDLILPLTFRKFKDEDVESQEGDKVEYRQVRLDTTIKSNLERLFVVGVQRHLALHRRNSQKTFIEEELEFIETYSDLLVNRMKDPVQKEAYFSLQDWKDHLMDVKPTGDRKGRISKASIAAFCQMIRDCGIIPKGGMSNAEYCMMVCEEFSLEYSDKVRQSMSAPISKKQTQKVLSKILPIIDDKVAHQLSAKYSQNQFTIN